MSKYPTLAVTGRFQPFHRDHAWLVDHALSLSDCLLIGITNPDVRSLVAFATSEHRHLPHANPFSYLERQQMIRAALAAAGIPSGRYEIVPFPLDSPAACSAYVPIGTPQLVRVFSEWEQTKVERLETAGYPVVVLQGDASRRVSGSRVRAALSSGEPWERWVPDAVARYILAMDVEALRRRCTPEWEV